MLPSNSTRITLPNTQREIDPFALLDEAAEESQKDLSKLPLNLLNLASGFIPEKRSFKWTAQRSINLDSLSKLNQKSRSPNYPKDLSKSRFFKELTSSSAKTTTPIDDNKKTKFQYPIKKQEEGLITLLDIPKNDEEQTPVAQRQPNNTNLPENTTNTAPRPAELTEIQEASNPSLTNDKPTEATANNNATKTYIASWKRLLSCFSS